MSKEELIKAVNAGEIDDKTLSELVSFMWDFDPYGIMNEYFGLSDDARQTAIEQEILYVVRTEPKILIEMLEAA